MVVVPSPVVPLALRLLRANRIFVSAEQAQRHVEQSRLRPAPFSPPRRLGADVAVTAGSWQGWPVYTLAPATGPVSGAVVYAHGGGWVNQIVLQHWQLAAQIAAEARTTVVVPIYPLVPFGTSGQVVPAVAELVLDSRERYGSTCLGGDSAGGQIALSAALVLRDEHDVVLPRTVLLSPALDLSLSNPEIDHVQPSDPWLGRPGTRVLVEHWRGDLPLDDPRVSPLAGELSGLGPLTVLSGTRDILAPDIRLLAARAEAAGVEIELVEQEGLVHVYPLTPTADGGRGRALVVDRVRAATAGG